MSAPGRKKVLRRQTEDWGVALRGRVVKMGRARLDIMVLLLKFIMLCEVNNLTIR